MHHFGDIGNFELHCELGGSRSGARRSFASRLCQRSASVEANAYSDSKLAMNLLACELQRRLDQGSSKSTCNDRSCEGTCDDDVAPAFEGRRGNLRSPATTLSSPLTEVRRGRACAVNPGAVASDIWRGVPRLMKALLLDPIMAVAFLNPDEGCATSVHAATQVLLDPLGVEPVTYFSPYVVPDWASLPFEVAGPFVGARRAPQSLPANEPEASRALWELSERTIRAIEAAAVAGQPEGFERVGSGAALLGGGS